MLISTGGATKSRQNCTVASNSQGQLRTIDNFGTVYGYPINCRFIMLIRKNIGQSKMNPSTIGYTCGSMTSNLLSSRRLPQNAPPAAQSPLSASPTSAQPGSDSCFAGIPRTPRRIRLLSPRTPLSSAPHPIVVSAASHELRAASDYWVGGIPRDPRRFRLMCRRPPSNSAANPIVESADSPELRAASDYCIGGIPRAPRRI